MTLFRKVFQNQARPALRDDGPEEAALRSAFTDMDTDSQPLVLDPFNHKTQSEAATDHCPQEPAVALDEDQPETHWQHDNAVDTTDAEVIDLSGEAADDFADHVGDDPDAEATDLLTATEGAAEQAPEAPEPAYQTDEEIAACLDRAIAAEVPNPVDHEPAEMLGHDLGAGEDGAEPTHASEHDRLLDRDEDFTYDLQESSDLGREKTLADEVPEMRPGSADGIAPETGPEPVIEPDVDLSAATGLQAVPAPAVGRAGRRVGRVKTRLLGFNRTGDVDHDPFGQAPEATATAQREKYPVGWLVIVEGPGVGHAFSIFTGASMIGRGEDQVIRLDFGDSSISRSNHAAIAYDEEQNKFYIGHGGKSNIIRRNARPVLSTEELNHADLIRIGETTLRFVALCGSDFQWKTAGGAHDAGI